MTWLHKVEQFAQMSFQLERSAEQGGIKNKQMLSKGMVFFHLFPKFSSFLVILAPALDPDSNSKMLFSFSGNLENSTLC